jgi:hypothetical protein
MRNATCARTETSKLPTYVALLYGFLFYAKVIQIQFTCRILLLRLLNTHYHNKRSCYEGACNPKSYKFNSLVESSYYVYSTQITITSVLVMKVHATQSQTNSIQLSNPLITFTQHREAFNLQMLKLNSIK